MNRGARARSPSASRISARRFERLASATNLLGQRRCSARPWTRLSNDPGRASPELERFGREGNPRLPLRQLPGVETEGERAEADLDGSSRENCEFAGRFLRLFIRLIYIYTVEKKEVPMRFHSLSFPLPVYSWRVVARPRETLSSLHPSPPGLLLSESCRRGFGRRQHVDDQRTGRLPDRDPGDRSLHPGHSLRRHGEPRRLQEQQRRRELDAPQV